MSAPSHLLRRGSAVGAGHAASEPAGPEPLTITREDYGRIYPKLAAKVRQFGIRDSQIEDLVQEAFQVAHEGLLAGSFGNRSALDTWVISIGKNLCLKHHRAHNTAKRNAPEVPLDDSSPGSASSTLPLRSDSPSPEREAEARELLFGVLGLIRGLPAMLREPLLLKVRGHSYGQISRLLAIPPELVSSRIHQARAELRRKLPDVQGPSAR